MLASALSGVPYSLTIHGPFEFDQPALLALGEKVRRSRFTAAVCDFGRSQLLRWTAPADWPKIQVVRCGVHLNGAAFTAPNGERMLLCVGRLGREKGHLVLLDAIARLRDELGFAVVIVGDGPARGEIEARATALGIEERVRLTGWLAADDIRNHILRCRALVLPTFAEGLPVVLMEAFALGRPVITSYVAGIPELVQPGVSGWVVPAGSVDELARALREALSADPQRLAGMGRAGAARVRERHDQASEARRLAALIENAHVLL
jgi:glycosyltransferase involved in cell wall biosynthesis